MKRLALFASCLAALIFVAAAQAGNEIDKILIQENVAHKVTLKPMPQVDDLVFLRRISIDLIGRIPTQAEVEEFLAWPSDERREKVVDKLLADPRFNDRWTVFFGDMLRLRSNRPGGEALTAFVHQSLVEERPYDELARRLITTNGRAGKTPEAGFVLADDADPLAMASITSQVFLGVRIGCAQCHDHPFDVWKREDFYGMAAFYGKTRRYENDLTNTTYTTEGDQSVVLWPPDDNASNRKPMPARFPFELSELDDKAPHVARFRQLRAEIEAQQVAAAQKAPTVDDLLNETSSKIASTIEGPDPTSEARSEIRKIDIQKGLYRESELREQLADYITDPRNRYFSRALANRVWAELVGRGFVEPVDDFRDDNEPSHLKTLDYIADEFVASGFRFKSLVRMIVTSDIYARAHAPMESDELTRQELEGAFLATPMRVMISEALFDSLVTAGHLFEYKHKPGQNPQVVYETVRVKKDAKPGDKKPGAKPLDLVGGKSGKEPMAMAAPSMMAANARGGAYSLEQAIEVDFQQVLVESAKDDVEIDEMQAMSQEEIEAQRMLQQSAMEKSDDYITQTIKKVYDANPKFNTSLRMPAPAPEGHFLRVFGQTARVDLGEARSQSPSMRQALMMLNGKLTHEASRVGELEPMHALVSGKTADLDQAVKLAYLEIMTRAPSATELAEGKQIVLAAKTPVDGMADLRWVLLNCNEFRFIP